jgi:hypothetical protein
VEKTLITEQKAIINQFQTHIDAEIRGDLDTTHGTLLVIQKNEAITRKPTIDSKDEIQF